MSSLKAGVVAVLWVVLPESVTVTVLSVDVSDEVTEDDPVEVSPVDPVDESVVTVDGSAVVSMGVTVDVTVGVTDAVVLSTSGSKTRSQISESDESHREIQGLPLAAFLTLQTKSSAQSKLLAETTSPLQTANVVLEVQAKVVDSEQTPQLVTSPQPRSILVWLGIQIIP